MSVIEILYMYLDFSREAKVCDLEELVLGNEDIATGKISVYYVQTGQILLQDRERGGGEGGKRGGEGEREKNKRERKRERERERVDRHEKHDLYTFSQTCGKDNNFRYK